MKRRNRVTLTFVGIALSLGMMSCFGDMEDFEVFNDYAQYQVDSVIIDDYLTDNNINAYNIRESGAFISIFHHGTEAPSVHPIPDTDTSTTYQYVTTGYKGYLTNGTVFDETDVESTYTFLLSRVILGWQLGISEMSKGDSAILVIPSYLGYGNSTSSRVPANSVLIFDVFLDSFEKR